MLSLAADKMRLIVTGRCNLDCFYCHNEGQVKEETFTRVDDLRWLADALRHGEVAVNDITISGGEPLLHPQLDSLVAVAADLCAQVALVSNGLLATPQRLDRLAGAGLTKLRLGVDSLEKTKPRPSPGHLDRPFTVASVIAAARRAGLAVDMNAVVTKFNRRQVGTLARFAVDHGVSMKFFEHVTVHTFGADGRGGLMTATPHVTFDEFVAHLTTALGSDVAFQPAPEFGEANLRCLIGQVEIRYCRYLCPFGLCRLTGTRVDPQGYVYSCMSNRGIDRLTLPLSTEEILHTMRQASARPCRAGVVQGVMP